MRLLVTNAAPVLQRALEDAGFEVMNPRKPEQLRENIVLVTASAVEDYPDVAVAIPLASAWDADIVVLPRRLEMDTDLRIALLEKTDEVRQGVVVGGPAVLEPELRTLLRAHARAAAAGRRQQALSEKSLVDSVVALVVGVVVFLAFRKSAEVFDMTADLPGGRRAALASLFGSARDRITRRSEHVPWGARLTTERCNARADDRRHHLKSRVDALVSELSTQLETLTAELERRARGPEAGGADGRISTAPDAGPVPPARDVEPVLRTLTRLRHALADLQTATSHATGDGHVLLFAAEYALLGWRLPGRLEQHVDGVQSARSLPDRRQQPLLFLRGVLRAVEADLDAPDPVVPNQTIARPDAPRALSGPGR